SSFAASPRTSQLQPRPALRPSARRPPPGSRAMTDDLDRIMAVMEEAFDPAFGEAWTRRQVGDSLLLPNTGYLLAGADGEEPAPGDPAAGFVLWRGAAGEEEILLIAVHPDHRRKGIGRALLDRFAAEARERGTDRLFLE